ncbi:MAG: alcohol dehydrogenase [Christensenellaceae bacterium]|nr:alcohol dehydrogenase [Christensenellaceae bacterium]
MQKTMKALVYHGPGKISLDDVPTPQIIDPHDAIVRPTLSTICGTDIHIQHGGVPTVKPGTILGHEFCGEIVALGDAVKTLKVGDKVAASCITQCGECFYCLRGLFSQCERGGSWLFGNLINGCQAEYVRVPYAYTGLHLIPEGLKEEDLLFIGDILSTGYFGAENGNIQPGDTVAVFGCGPVGMCAMATARLWGPAQIIAIDTNESRLNVAKKQGIADICINPSKENIVEKIRALTKGRGADVTIEAVGASIPYDACIEAVRPGGTVSIIGVFEQPQTLKLNELWSKNITIKMGLVNSNHLPRLIDLIKAGKINMKFLQTHKAPLNEILKGYDIFGNKKDNCIKWLVTPIKH